MQDGPVSKFLREDHNYLLLLFPILLLILEGLQLPPVFDLLFFSLSPQSYALLRLSLVIASLVCLILFFAFILFSFALPLYQIWSFSQRPDFALQEMRRSSYLRRFEERLTARMEELISQHPNSAADVKVLQGQISPHFLYNTLDSLRGELYLRKMPDLAEMVETLSELFRYSISPNDPLIPLEAEIENADKYISMMQFRFPNKFIVHKHFDKTNNDLLSIMVPKFILQPIIENSISHGLEPKLGPGRIVIDIFHTEKTLCLQVSDDGLGIPADKLDQINAQLSSNVGMDNHSGGSGRGTGLALLNINGRIRLLYGSDYGVSVASSPNKGTQVQIMLPFKE